MEDAPLAFGVLAAVARVTGCLLVAPGLSNARVPAPVRLFLSLGIALAIVPHVRFASLPADDAAGVALVLAAEGTIGLAMGLVARFAMLALSFAATHAAMLCGYGNIPGIAPDERAPEPTLSAFISLGALMLAFQADLHHLLVRALARSYAVLPVLEPLAPAAMAQRLTDSLAVSFAFAVQLTAPFLAYALMFNLAAGILNKLVPQIPVYFVSLPLLIGGGLVIVWLTLPEMLTIFAAGFETLDLLP